MLQCFSLKVVPFRNGLVLWLINGLLLISAEMSQGVAQNPLVHINMVLLAQTFGSSGWRIKPIRLHKHVMVLCQVPNKEPCEPCGYVARKPTTLHTHREPSFAHGEFESWSTRKSTSTKGIKRWRYCMHPRWMDYWGKWGYCLHTIEQIVKCN